MKNLHYIFFVLILSLTVQTQAQQDPHFSLYKYNLSIINPAFTGINFGLESIFGVRSQWTAVRDAPETFSFNVNSPLGNNVGLGLSIIRDDVFVLSETHVYADFSYRIKLSNTLDLYAGLKAGGSFLDIPCAFQSSLLLSPYNVGVLKGRHETRLPCAFEALQVNLKVSPHSAGHDTHRVLHHVPFVVGGTHTS